MKAVWVRTSPSLALVKYWGKQTRGRNLPATPSIAVTLGGLDTTSIIQALSSDQVDEVRLGGHAVDLARFEPFFSELRGRLGSAQRYLAISDNSFPTSAGLASSSSGFAALGLGCVYLASDKRSEDPVRLNERLLALASELSRAGSASAARAVYGGFTYLPAGAKRAQRLYGPEHWPQLRVLVAVTSTLPKTDSSRGAMERTRLSSPYFGSWVRDARKVCAEALTAVDRRDLQRLGELARLSYLRMHASAMAADPPVIYWLPASLGVIQVCAALRARGIGAWETMDAGPQVKILCLEPELAQIQTELAQSVPGLGFIQATVGPDPDLRPWQSPSEQGR